MPASPSITSADARPSLSSRTTPAARASSASRPTRPPAEDTLKTSPTPKASPTPAPESSRRPAKEASQRTDSGLPGPAAFAGADIATLAGLRWDPAFPRPRFESGTWQLDGWADAPVQMARAEKRWDFTKIPNPRWQSVARELTAAWLAPHHELVLALPRARRKPRHPRTCASRLFYLTAWLNWLTDRGITTLAAVTQRECDAFLSDYGEILDASGQVVRHKRARSLVTVVSVMKDIADYGDLLTADGYQKGFVPWPGRTAGKVTGAPVRPSNTTPPLPEEVLRPLLAACLYMTGTIGPHVVALRDMVARDRQHTAGLPRRLPSGDLRQAFEAMLASDYTGPGQPLPELPGGIVTRRLRHYGWAEGDRLLRVSLAPPAHRIGLQPLTGGTLPNVRDLIEDAAAAVGVAPAFGRDAVPVTRADGDGRPVPRTLPVRAWQADTLADITKAACLLTVAAFTGMRASELLELLPGCRMPPEETPSGLARYRLAGKVVKGRRWGGERDEWVVIEPVYRAIGLAEQLAAGTPARSLFSWFSSTRFRSERYEALRGWVNSPAGERLGLAPVPDYPVIIRALRRTLSLEMATRPGGILAAKVALKHISVTTTEGYAARPGGAQAVFHAEWKADEARENLRLTVEAFRQFQQGQLPAGPGAARLAEAFRSVEEALTGHDPGTARTTATDRQVELLLKAKAETLHQGAANYCWFDDPGQALCLKLAGVSTAKTPLAGMCDSARCPQATHHQRHRPVWASAAETTAAMLASPRVPPGEKQRLRRDHDRALRIIEAIDKAGPAGPEEN